MLGNELRSGMGSFAVTRREVAELVVVQDVRDGVAHAEHRVLDRTALLLRIGTVAAFLIGGLADTADRREGAVQNSDHLAESDVLGRLDEAEPPVTPRRLPRRPAFLSVSRICSRNSIGICCRLAIS